VGRGHVRGRAAVESRRPRGLVPGGRWKEPADRSDEEGRVATREEMANEGGTATEENGGRRVDSGGPRGIARKGRGEGTTTAMRPPARTARAAARTPLGDPRGFSTRRSQKSVWGGDPTPSKGSGRDAAGRPRRGVEGGQDRRPPEEREGKGEGEGGRAMGWWGGGVLVL